MLAGLWSTLVLSVSSHGEGEGNGNPQLECGQPWYQVWVVMRRREHSQFFFFFEGTEEKGSFLASYSFKP